MEEISYSITIDRASLSIKHDTKPRKGFERHTVLLVVRIAGVSKSAPLLLACLFLASSPAIGPILSHH